MVKQCLFLSLVLCLVGCAPHSHDDEHAHDEGGHAHEEEQTSRVTLWDDEVGLVMEYADFIIGEPTRFVTHVTYLDQWQPKREGAIKLTLSKEGDSPINVDVSSPSSDGIYTPSLTFPSAGAWQVTIQVPTDTAASELALELTVFNNADEAERDALFRDPPPEGISFTLEQQWRMEFASEPVSEQPFRESLLANGTVTARADGEVIIHAPVNGRLIASGSTIPHIGNRVEKGQLLGSLIPRLQDAADPATLNLALQRAELDHNFAKNELARIKRLFQEEVVAESSLHLAELEVKKTRANLASAKERLEQFSDAQKSSGGASKGRVDLYSPLTGTIIEANVVPGALTEEDDPMFQIIDLTRVWLTVQIPEGDIGRIADANGAWFTVEGMDRVFEVNEASGGRLIALGGRIDPVRRSVPLIFELPNPDERLKIGMFAQVSVLTGATATGPSVPRSALVEEQGQTVAYVQLEGETFERRVLQLGIRDGDRVHVVSGLEPGERVVTKGAYPIRLAASSDAVPAHGHSH